MNPPTTTNDPSPKISTRSVSPNAQSCCACRHQRRKCSPDCALAQYFPADRYNDFLNAHKLFGVSNMVKALNRAPPGARDAAMNSIMYHAIARRVDPVHGCHGIVMSLMKQVEFYQAELNLVTLQVHAFRALAATQIDSGSDCVNGGAFEGFSEVRREQMRSSGMRMTSSMAEQSQKRLYQQTQTGYGGDDKDTYFPGDDDGGLEIELN